MDGGRNTPPPKPPTYLQRAFDAFELAQPLCVRSLAAMLRCEVASAYNYIARLKRQGKITYDETTTTARCPMYVLVEGAARPTDDSRGRKPSRGPTLTARWKRTP